MACIGCRSKDGAQTRRVPGYRAPHVAEETCARRLDIGCDYCLTRALVGVIRAAVFEASAFLGSSALKDELVRLTRGYITPRTRKRPLISVILSTDRCADDRCILPLRVRRVQMWSDGHGTARSSTLSARPRYKAEGRSFPARTSAIGLRSMRMHSCSYRRASYCSMRWLASLQRSGPGDS